jgi:TRAP-type C4-dicarboxylate transport system substrate-binding protein
MTNRKRISRALQLAAFVLAAAINTPQVRAQDNGTPKRYSGPALKLKVIGGLASVHQYTRHEQRFWQEVLPARTDGKVTAEIAPFDKAGIRGTEVLRLMQVGAVPFGTALLGVSASTDPDYGAADLAGLNPDIRSMRKIANAMRPVMADSLRERYGIQLLALYAYPAQMIFCREKFTGLADLKGRRIRTATPSQGDFVEALGATAVRTPFAEIIDNMQSGNTDCAITGSMSGNTIGLHERTTHIFTMPVSWGISMFGANMAAWRALPEGLRPFLQSELAKLEADIWNEAERETSEGVACNVGARGCSNGRAGSMIEVRPGPQDLLRRQQIFNTVVLPRWITRCGKVCSDLWSNTLRPLAESGTP